MVYLLCSAAHIGQCIIDDYNYNDLVVNRVHFVAVDITVSGSGANSTNRLALTACGFNIKVTQRNVVELCVSCKAKETNNLDGRTCHCQFLDFVARCRYTVL